MKWQDVRKAYPNQFVKIEILKSHIEDDKQIIEDVAVIDIIDEKEATKELLTSKGNMLVYHTSKPNLLVKIRNRIGLRRS
ncbi:MAG: hypothetical protein N4A68_14285 [Maledivibacter sp.]|jgi:RNA-binding protein YhbY|nr:hypothetical protein [Maledivibacter sp.]